MSNDCDSLISLHTPPDSIQPINTLSISINPIQPQSTSVSALSQSSSDGGLGAGFACSGGLKYHPHKYFTNFPDMIEEWHVRYIQDDGGLEFFSKIFWKYYDWDEGEHVVEGDVCKFF
jgi:hypothetical protein